MPLDRQPRILGIHAVAVVFDADQLLAAELDRDRDAPRPGVDRVLDQLLDDGRGPLDDFAGGDLIGEIRGKPVDSAQALRFPNYPISNDFQMRYIQPLRRKNQSMAPEIMSMNSSTHSNWTSTPPGSVRQRHVHAPHAGQTRSAASTAS